MKHAIFRCVLMLLAFFLSSKAAQAYRFNVTQMSYVSTGVNLGTAIYPERSSSFIFGGEASLVYLSKSLLWAGGYTDLVYDFGTNTRRFSIGPEIGYTGLGIDGGYLVSARDQEFHYGFQLRAVLTLGSLVTLGLRWGHLVGEVEHPDFTEFNVLFKIPIPLD